MPPPLGQFAIRRGSRETVRSLNTLSHAIEYLSDQFVEAEGSAADHKGRLQAIQLLMGLHQRVYSGEATQGSHSLDEPVLARMLAAKQRLT